MSGTGFDRVDLSGHRFLTGLGARTAVVCLAVLFFAQAAMASTLSGVVSAAGQPVGNAFVAATGPDGQAAAVSGSDGSYTLTLPDGTYRVATNAPGYLASVTDGVVVSSASTQDVALTASGAPLAPLPIFGGAPTGVAADGTPGVFYMSGGNVGDLFRSVDYGGTWTPVTVASDDPTNGMSGAGNPQLVTTSGFPGEVAVLIPTPAGVVLPSGQSLGASAVVYSTDYGVTWHVVGNTPRTQFGQNAVVKLMWGHAGSTSVLVALASNGGPAPSAPTAMYVADMTAASPSFVEMTAPYAPPTQPMAVGDGGDQPWLATVDSAGNLSVFPLVAQATAPAADADAAQSGFPTDPVGIALGGATANGVPPAGVAVMSSSGMTMSVKGAATDTGYPAPGTLTADCHPGPNSPINLGSAQVTANTGGSYGAAVIGSCWVQDAAGTITAQGYPGNVAIDAGYDATNTSRGSDAVALVQGAPGPSCACYSLLRGATKMAASSGGFPGLPTEPAAAAQPGTDPSAAGASIDGFTAAGVAETTYGPAGTSEVASATDAGGFASADGGATFHLTSYDGPESVAWWQGAAGNSWLLFGLSTFNGANTVAGFENWTSAAAPVGGQGSGNVSGSSSSALGASGDNFVQAIAGVPDDDTAFLDLSEGDMGNRVGVVRRVTVAAGPSFSNVTPIGDGVITTPGPVVYCPSLGPTGSFGQNVLLVIGENGSSGEIYRVTGATASPTVSPVATLQFVPGYNSQPSLAVDCATGTVLAAAGIGSTALLESSDGGQSFTSVPTPAQDGIVAVAIVPGTLGQSIVIGDGGGFIYASNDGGQTWPFVENDPGTGVNLGVAENASGGLRDFIAGASGPSMSADSSYGTMLDPRAAPLAHRPDLVAGPGEFAGNLTPPVGSPPANTGLPSISGAPVRGQRLHTTNGTWDNRPTSFTYQWRDCNRAGNSCESITGATASTHVLNATDVGHTLRVVVTARSAHGSTPATSGRTATITAAPAVTHASLGSRTFEAKQGTTLRLTLSAPATITVLISKPASGRKVTAKGKCKAGARSGKRCTVMVQQAKLTFHGAPGRNSFKFRVKSLAPGRYTVTLAARGPGSSPSKPITVTFTIKNPKRR